MRQTQRHKVLGKSVCVRFGNGWETIFLKVKVACLRRLFGYFSEIGSYAEYRISFYMLGSSSHHLICFSAPRSQRQSARFLTQWQKRAVSASQKNRWQILPQDRTAFQVHKWLSTQMTVVTSSSWGLYCRRICRQNTKEDKAAHRDD